MTVPLHFPVSEVILLRVLIATDCSISARSDSSSGVAGDSNNPEG